MTELYSVKDVARIFSLQESRLRYWLQTGFIKPSVRRGGRFFYTFQDLINIKAAKELLDAGISMQKVRTNLDSLREILPDVHHPSSRLRICSDGESIVAVEDDIVFEPATGQVVMAFALSTLSNQVTEVLALPIKAPSTENASDTSDGIIGGELDTGPTESHEVRTAYQWFIEGTNAEEHNKVTYAESCYRRAISEQPSLSAAHTNLGNLLYRNGNIEGARAAYEAALDYEPGQPEARYNLANILEDMGDTEMAIAELRRVCYAAPEFADAHYNLGLMLARVGGTAQAQKHLERYLELDGNTPWATKAREFLDSMSA